MLYSNRAICRIHLKNYSGSLEDSNKCIELKPAWFKGYSNKGAAYYNLRNFKESKTSYQKALLLDPGNVTVKNALDAAIEELNRPSAYQNLWGTAESKKDSLYNFNKILIILSGLIVLISFGKMVLFFRMFHILNLLNIFTYIYRTYGVPELNQQVLLYQM